MGDKGPRHAEHPREARERSGGELRELPVVAGRQIVANLADLLFDEVEVVEQPLGGRRDCAAFADRFRDGAIRFEQNRLVVLQSRGKRSPPRRPRGDGLGRRKALGMLLEALDTEELLADRFLVIPRRGLRRAPEDPQNCRSQGGSSSPRVSIARGGGMPFSACASEAAMR